MQANVEQIEQDIQNFKKQLKIERNLSEHTLRAYECDLHCMLRWIETYHIRALNDKVTMSYFNYLQDEEHLGARSIRRKYVSLRQFFEFLGETYDVHEKFFRFSSRKFQVPKTLPKTLERSEIQRFLSAASKNFQAAGTEYQIWLALRDMCILELLFSLGLRVGDDDDKIRLNQRKPSKYKGLRRFGPEKNLQRINKFMKERPIFYKNLIQMKENIRFYLRCFYCITKVMILQFNSENRTELARNG